ncbi:MAG: sulfotransferase, partial [Gammaproteobacteria bacterium]
LERALELRPGYPGALAALATIRRPRTDDPLCREIEAALAGEGLPREERERLLFALGAACDRSAEYDRAFELFDQGNRLHREAVDYDAGAFEANVERMLAEYEPGRWEHLRAADGEAPDPVFIVGMPRSGSTLIEQILACHPQIGAAGEVTALEQAGGGLARRLWLDPAQVAGLDREQVAAVAADYRRRVAQAAAGRPLVTDKMLSNHRFLHLAAALFPRARVIHCLRDPRDACFSAWTHLFYRAAYTFDLEELGRTWVATRRLLEFWREVLPIPVIPVRYEALVSEPEAQVRSLLEALGLPWDERCLRFHESDRVVHTASTGQVRRPLYTSSVGRWRNYERHLGPLLEALGPVL